MGIITGSHLAGFPGGMHPRDYHLFTQMNSLAHAAGAGEGFLPIGHGAMGLLSLAGKAGRVPT